MNTALSAIWSRAIKPEPEIEPWQWLEQNVRDIPYSPIPGRFNSDFDPGIREVINAICDASFQVVVLKVAIQKWKTLAIELAITWKVKNNPAPTIFYQDQDANAGDEMETRMLPLLQNTDGVKDLIPAGRDRYKSKRKSIAFRNGMQFWCLGASNSRNRQRRSIQAAFLDECWQYPKDKAVIKEVAGRTTAFGYLGKLVAASQGSEEGDEFDELWKTTDQRVAHVACPKCGTRQPMDFFKGLEFETIKDDDGNYDYRAIAPTVRYQCQVETCGAEWPDTDETRRDLNQSKQFISTNSTANPRRVGFTDTALTSKPWHELVEEYLRAKVISWSGDMVPLKTFYQQRLALAWGEADDGDFTIEINAGGYLAEDAEQWPDEGRLYVRGGKVSVIRKPLVNLQGTWAFRSIVADVQRECFWVTIRSWSISGASRLLWAGKIVAWSEIEGLQARYGVASPMVFIDCGDKPGAEVYPQCAKHGWTALRGDHPESWPHKVLSREKDVKPKTVRRPYSPVRRPDLGGGATCNVFHWSNIAIKDILAKLMKIPDKWQTPDDVDRLSKDYRAQMDSERRTKKNGKWIWLQIGKRPNHLWDCEAMQVVVGVMCKVIGAEVEQGESGGAS